MISINDVCRDIKVKKLPVSKVCHIKNYISIDDKQKFCEEYGKLVKEHVKDYPSLPGYVPLVFLDLLVVKYYTDIDIKLDYESYDELMKNGIINGIASEIEDEYKLLMKLALAYLETL